MIEREAWLLLAHRFFTEADRSATAGYMGTCFALDELVEEELITGRLSDRMEDRFYAMFAPTPTTGYFWPRDTEGEICRGWAALLLAEISEGR